MASLKVTVDQVSKVLGAIEALVTRQVLVGVPSSKAERKQASGNDSVPEPVNNAMLGYINEFGSPANNIPARPFLRPGVQDAKDDISRHLGRAASAALAGKKGAVGSELNAAGMAAQNAVRTRINDGTGFQSLALSTIQARARRGRKGAKKYLRQLQQGPAESGLVKPLVDTGQLRNAITYIVRKK